MKNFEVRKKEINERNENEKEFIWYVKKKQQGFYFGGLEPLHKISKEDYEDFCSQYEELRET